MTDADREFLAVPYGAGAVVAFVPAFQDETTRTEKTWSIVFGSLLGLHCLFTAITPDLLDSYQRNLDASGLDLYVGLGSASLAYRF